MERNGMESNRMEPGSGTAKDPERCEARWPSAGPMPEAEEIDAAPCHAV